MEPPQLSGWSFSLSGVGHPRSSLVDGRSGGIARNFRDFGVFQRPTAGRHGAVGRGIDREVHAVAGQLRARIRSTWALAPVALVAVIAVALAGGGSAAPAASTTPSAAKASDHPNIVFVLTDDLSWNLAAVHAERAAHAAPGRDVQPTTSSRTRCAARRARRSSPALPAQHRRVHEQRRPTAASASSTTAARSSDTFATALAARAATARR